MQLDTIRWISLLVTFFLMSPIKAIAEPLKRDLYSSIRKTEETVEELRPSNHLQSDALSNEDLSRTSLQSRRKQTNLETLLYAEGNLADSDKQLNNGSLYDEYTFEGEKGQIVRVSVGSDDFNTLLILLDDEREFVAANDNATISDTDSEIIYRLLRTGTYRVIVNSHNSEERGAYQLTAQRADDQALRLSERRSEANELFSQGITAYNGNQYQAAIKAWQAAAEIYKDIGTQTDEVGTLINIGVAYINLSEYPSAISTYERALDIARETGEQRGEATSLLGLGSAYDEVGKYQQALDLYNQALKISTEIEYRQGIANALGGLGLVYFNVGKYEQAIELQEEALELIDSDSSLAGKAKVLGNLGITYFELSQYERAADFHQQALDLAIAEGDKRSQANSLGNLGNTYDRVGEYERAISFHQQALEIQREIDDKQGIYDSLGNIGLIYRVLGRYAQAVDFHELHLSGAREINDKEGEATALGNLGIAYRILGNYQKSIEYHRGSLDISRSLNDRQSEVNALGNLGLVYRILGEYQQAINYHQQSLNIAKAIKNRQSEANALGNLGLVYERIGDYERAVAYLSQQLDIVQEISDRQGKANALGNLGNTYVALGDYERAINLLAQQLEISSSIGDRQNEAAALTNLGTSQIELDNFELAQSYLSKAVDVFEDLRAGELADQDRINLFETQTRAYQSLELSLILQSKFEEALEASERGRARSFVQLLSENLDPDSKDSALIGSLNFSDIQRIVKEQGSTLVKYSISRGSHTKSPSLYIWVVQPTGELHFKEVSLSDRVVTLSKLIAESRTAMNVRGRGGLESEARLTADSADAQLRELHQLLIEPISSFLPTEADQKIVFIPANELLLVPFAALQDESGQYLIQKHTVLSAPSIQVLDLTRQRAAINRPYTTEILSVGNPTTAQIESQIHAFAPLPPLPSAEEEAKVIASFFDKQALIGSQATEQAVRQQIEGARIVHLATHGLLEYGTDEDSRVQSIPGAIALTPTDTEDGLLTASEIVDELKLQADLVVLSACDTGLGRITGDGIVGLSRSFIAAGAPSVIVSLWSIPDAPTAELMVEFYRQRQQGLDKAQSLRQSMLETMKTHPNPRDWAAFMLIGQAS